VKHQLFLAVAEIALIAAAPTHAQVALRPPAFVRSAAPSQPSQDLFDDPDAPIATAPAERAPLGDNGWPVRVETRPIAAPSPVAASYEAPAPDASPPIEEALDTDVPSAGAARPAGAPSVLAFAHAASFGADAPIATAPPVAAPPVAQAPESAETSTQDRGAPGGGGAASSSDAKPLSLAQVTVRLPGAPRLPPPTTPMIPQPAPGSAFPSTPGSAAPAKPALGPYGRPHINPYRRDIDMTVPLMYREQSLGDLPVRITFDDRFFVETAGFLQLIDPKLTTAAQAGIAKTLAAKQMFTGDDLSSSGVQLEYDPSSLSIVVLSIDPDKRAVERLFDHTHDDEGPPDIKPAVLSGYMNLTLNEAVYESGGTTTAPTVGLSGAIRFRNFVLEYEGSLGDQANGDGTTLATTGESYGFQRDFVRLVYDQPDQFRRWYLGDLTPEIRGDQSFVEMGGIGVLRSRQPFNDFQAAVLQTNRQLLLQNDSDITILRNGVVYQQLHLRAGSYDLSALPLLTGSNDVQIQVRDNTGATQQLTFQSYLDPIDLQPGDYEYGAFLGPVSRSFDGNSPNYDGPLAFTGFYRKAFLNLPAVGVGLQLAKDVQDVTGQTQFTLWRGARLLFDAGLSHSETTGAGFAVGASYEQTFNRSGLVDSLTLRADYLSQHFAGLGDPSVDNADALTVSGQYARAINRRMTITADVSYTNEREGKGDDYRGDLDLSYAISKQWSVRAGIDYAHFNETGALGEGFGGTLSIVWQPSYRTRAEARYDSTIDSAALSMTHAGDGRIGSLGYGALLSRNSGQLDVAGFADYIGNRFDAAIAQSSGSTGTVGGFGGFGAQNVTSVTVDTSIAFADGAWGVGRRIPDSFALLYGHPSLEGRPVLAGQSIEGNNYIAESGLLGAAVNNALVDYTTQSVQYNVINPPDGYDIGTGVERVRPPYRSGYKIQVGTDAFVTATGTLDGPDGKPISLIGGRVVAIGRPDLQPLPFFTNSVGRFGLIGLRPALRYRVDIYLEGRVVPAFEFSVPKNTKGLVKLNVVPMQKMMTER
jgi:outer membrane usher protein